LPRIEDDGTEAKDLLIIFVFSRGPLRVHFALRFSYPVIAIQIHFIKKNSPILYASSIDSYIWMIYSHTF